MDRFEDAGAGTTGIVVTGVGTVSVEAEIATLRVGVSVSGTSLDDARAAVGSKATAARDHLVSAGVEAADIATSSLSVYNSDDRRLGRTTHHVSTRLTATIRAIDAAQTIVNDLFSVVSDGMELHGLSFGSQDPNRGRDSATTLAFEDATAKARHLAELAGVTLGPVVSIVEGDGGGGHAPPRMMRAMAAAESSIPIEAGELDQTVSVTVRWAIE
jgi:uncharacterized protein YggE